MELSAEFSRVLRCKAVSQTSDTIYSDKVYLPSSFLSSLLDSRNRTNNQNSAHNQFMAAHHRQPLHTPPDTNNASDYAFGDSDQLPSPLIFRLVQRSAVPPSEKAKHADRKAVYCGVREFSSEEGHVGVPEWLMRDAGLVAGDSVAVEFVRPEKGLFAQLQALDGAAKQVGDLRALLEAHMRSKLTALAVGETFQVPVGGMNRPLSFSVVALEPMNVVDIVDTDLSVDIVHADASVINSQMDDDSIGELVPGVAHNLEVTGGQSRIFQLHIPAQIKSTDVVVTCQSGGDVSVCASRLVRNVSILDNTWFDYSLPSQQPKRLRIEHNELPSGSNNVYVSIIGFAAATRATVEVHFDAHREAESTVLAETALEAGPNESVCTNCGSNVPKDRFIMHQTVCERHNSKCQHCPRVFKRGSVEFEQHWHCNICTEAGDVDDRDKHIYFSHTPHACSCNPVHMYASVIELTAHRRTECPERLIECQYCHTNVAQGSLPTTAEAILRGQHEHEWSCGSRSISCVKCKAYVPIRQVKTHMQLHEMKEQRARANIVPCVNRECARERGDNPLGLCAICFGPLYSGQHDPDNQRLLKRLARTMHSQLTSGCGSKQCKNLHCVSGRANVSNDVVPLTQTAAAAMLIPVLKAYAPLATATNGYLIIDYSGIDLHLCI
ncbi:hypothetical protein LPJ62_002543 [Coemansia sp. RSA 2167]|nr:hypothetical protein LPJ62_002543 [Coemansia sp. RSA 2167]KAJ2152697.1 hypothetical protein J3F82_002499 [Coemansia sp. RSA 637]